MSAAGFSLPLEGRAGAEGRSPQFNQPARSPSTRLWGEGLVVGWTG